MSDKTANGLLKKIKKGDIFRCLTRMATWEATKSPSFDNNFFEKNVYFFKMIGEIEPKEKVLLLEVLVSYENSDVVFFQLYSLDKKKKSIIKAFVSHDVLNTELSLKNAVKAAENNFLIFFEKV